MEEVVREWLKEEYFEISGGEEERGWDLSPLESAGFNLFTTSLAYFHIKTRRFVVKTGTMWF